MEEKENYLNMKVVKSPIMQCTSRISFLECCSKKVKVRGAFCVLRNNSLIMVSWFRVSVVVSITVSWFRVSITVSWFRVSAVVSIMVSAVVSGSVVSVVSGFGW